jgi:hypothetical protein
VFPFKTKVVKDPTAQLNWDQLAKMLPSRQHSVAFGLAAGAAATGAVTIHEGVPPALSFIVVGSPSYIGAYAGQAAVTWAWRYLSATQLEITLVNNGGVLATGILYFAIFRLDS